jgi:4-amino-4-deoxy-L-arabinose transferase-like glycosyltransferase
MGQTKSAWDQIPHWACARTTHRKLIPFGIFISALLLRAFYLWEDTASPFFAVGGVDSPTYLKRAASLLTGMWPGPFAFDQPPLYPAWIAAVSQVFGENIMALKLSQAVLGAMCCVLVYFIAQKAFRDFSVALLAALMCVVNGTLIYFDGQIVSANLEMFLQCAALWFFLKAEENKSIGWWLGAGAIVGLSAINRGGVLLCIPFLLVWAYRRDGVKAAAAVIIPVALFIAPITLHNFSFDHSRSVPNNVKAGFEETPKSSAINRLLNRKYVLLTSRTGMNFLLGNSYDEYELNDPNHPRCWIHTNRVMKYPYRETGAVSASGQQQSLMTRATETIANAPGDWFRLMGLKALQLGNGVEIPRNSNLYADRQYSNLLTALVWSGPLAFPTGLLIPLGLVGLYFSRRQSQKHSLLLAFLLPRVVFVLSFFVASRFRVPMLPIIAMFASYGILYGVRTWRAGQRSALVLPAIALVLLLIASNARLVPVADQHGAYEFFALAGTLAEGGDQAAALAEFQKAVDADPASPAANFLLGARLARLQQFKQSNTFLEAATQLEPSFTEALVRHGKNLAAMGQNNAARKQLKRALASDPGNAQIARTLKTLETNTR